MSENKNVKLVLNMRPHQGHSLIFHMALKSVVSMVNHGLSFAGAGETLHEIIYM